VPSREEPLLSFSEIRAGYGTRPAVDGVSLDVHAGEVVGLVGPNGSGKTTLVRVASRALRPWSGSVRVAGRDPYAMSGRELARLVAVVPQDVVPAFSFSVLEMVLMGRSPYRTGLRAGSAQDWSIAREAMVAVGVQHLADRPVEELSGGERRRVILAQALAQDAPALLLDEPTTHLDIRHVVDLLGIVRRTADRGDRAVVAVLHDLTLAASVCDRLVVLHRGSVFTEGPPDAVVTRELLRSVYEVDAEVESSRATGRPTVVLGSPGAVGASTGRKAHVVGGAGRGAPVFRRLAERGFRVSAGVLHGTDTDDEVAARLDLERVSVPAFSTIDATAAGTCLQMMRAADVVIVCDAPFGPGNIRNLELALEAAREGIPVVLIEEMPMTERDFTHGRATELWNELRPLACVAASASDAVAMSVPARS
jgi:iron complex transport system ATP-binding protein